MKKIIFLIVFGLAMCGFTFAQSPLAELEKIKEIKLLESTQNDARRILADYTLEVANNSHRNDKFSTENAHIEIWYSRGDCSVGHEEWNVPKLTVTEIVVSPINSVEFKDLGFDYSKFQREKKFKNLPNEYIYHNKNLGIAVDVKENEVYEITYFPPKENYSLLCNKDAVRKRYLGESIFADKLKDRIVIIDTRNYVSYVANLTLNRTEIISDCFSVDDTKNKNCSHNVKQIAIFTKAIAPGNDVLLYNYQITGGKVIGQGANVVWDLSDVKPGTYSITAAVDDGCGLCGKSITKTVIVKECPSCSVK